MKGRASILLHCAALTASIIATNASLPACQGPSSPYVVVDENGLNAALGSWSSGVACEGVISFTTGATTYQLANQVTWSKGGSLTLNASSVTGVTLVASESPGKRIFDIKDESLLTINGLKLTGGTSPDDFGGAIFAETSSNVTLESSILAGNKAVYGGAVTLFQGCSLTATSTLFEDNTASFGGAVAAAGALVTVRDCQLLSNTAAVTDGKTQAQGGAVWSQGSTIRAERTTFTRNTATCSGCLTDELYLEGGAIYSSGSVIELVDVTVSDGQARDGGGLKAYTSTVTLTGSSLFQNNSAWSGGALLIEKGAAFTATDARFIANYVLFPKAIAPDTEKMGGAIYLNGVGEFIGKNLHFERNHINSLAKSCHGGGGAIGAAAMTKRVRITGSRFIDNFSEKGAFVGGAIYFAGAVVDGQKSAVIDVKIEDSIFERNSAPTFGGALYFGPRYRVDMVDSQFKNNTAAQQGGAIVIEEDSVVSSSRGVFIGNTVKAGGGAVYLFGVGLGRVGSEFGSSHDLFDGNCVLDSTCSRPELAFFGGAISAGTESRLTVENSTFTNNFVDACVDSKLGGAIHAARGSSVQISGASFSSNSANRGGAITAENVASLTMTSSYFTTNNALGDALGDGGALFLNSPNRQTINNCSFEGNSAVTRGGAIMQAYPVADVLTVTDSYFQRNLAGSGAADIDSISSFVCTSTTAESTEPPGLCLVRRSSSLGF